MPKVRWTQKCAGGCGKILYSGSFGLRLHQNWFCATCASKHLHAGCAKH